MGIFKILSKVHSEWNSQQTRSFCELSNSFLRITSPEKWEPWDLVRIRELHKSNTQEPLGGTFMGHGRSHCSFKTGTIHCTGPLCQGSRTSPQGDQRCLNLEQTWHVFWSGMPKHATSAIFKCWWPPNKIEVASQSAEVYVERALSLEHLRFLSASCAWRIWKGKH